MWQAQNESRIMASERDKVLFSSLPDSTLAGRLVSAMGEVREEIASGPASYLRAAFSLDSSTNWVAVRLARDLGGALAQVVRHPFKFISDSRQGHWATVIALNQSTLSWTQFIGSPFVASALTPEPVVVRRRRRFRPVLAVSAFAHSFLILYIVYIGIISPFAGINVVRKPYRPFDPAMVGPLYYPKGMIRQPTPSNAMTLDEIRERARKRAEQLARQREKEEQDRIAREKAEQEKAEKEKQIADAKAAEEKKAADAKTGTSFGEFNETALKDVVGKIYVLYQAGGLDVDITHFSVMLGFKIEPDGSLSRIRVLKSSGSKSVDDKAADVLWTLGESHALGTLSSLSSNSIRLDLNETTARLTITSFAPSAEEAKRKATELNSLFFFLRLGQRAKNPDIAELLDLAKIRSENNRIDADLTVSRARAAELMRAKFGNAPSNPER